MTVPDARCAGLGTPESTRALLDGLCRALSDECADATLAGNDHEAAVLMCLLADVLDAVEALEE